MALIKCNECGKEISDKVKECIHCGNKVNVKKDSIKKQIKKTNKKSIFIIGGILLVLILVRITIFLFINHNSKSYVGKWEQNITWKRGGKVSRESYASFELLKNGTFNYVGYSKNMDDKIIYSGTYNKNNGIIYVYFKYEEQDYTGKLYINDNKLCINEENCEDYFVKSSSKDKNSITLNEEPTYISYEQYQSILSNSENAIVVFTADWCSHCKEYKEILNKVVNNYSTPIYYYEVEEDDIAYDTLNISGTPTTHIIKNGVNVETIDGKTEYSELSKILDKNNIE